MHFDFKKWKQVRYSSKEFLTPWEPKWNTDHLTRKSFSNRVYWSKKAINQGTGLPLFLFDSATDELYGAITLDNIRRGRRKVEPWDTGLVKNTLAAVT